MKKSEYYKVVYAEIDSVKNKLQRISTYAAGPCKVKYKIHRYVKSPVPNTGLLVFNNLADAKYYCVRLEDQIWRVLVKNPIKLPDWRIQVDLHNVLDVQELWSTGVLYHSVLSLWPIGTEAFEYVRLEERIL